MRRHDAFELRKPNPWGEMLEDGCSAIGRVLWSLRVEAVLYGLLGLWAYAGLALEPFPGTPILAAELAAVWWLQGPLHRALHASSVRRRWAKAVVDAGAADPPARTSRRAHESRGPRVAKIQEVPAGDLLQIRAARGSSVAQVVKYADRIGANLDAKLEVVPDSTSERRAEVLVRRRDPFAGRQPLAWPNLREERLSMWEPVPVGVDERGTERTLSLVESTMLIGGVPGAGKSVALSLPVATAALDPDCRLWLMDGKKVEFPAWAGAAYRYVDDNREDARAMLKELRGIVDERYEDLKIKGRRKIDRDDNLPLHVLVCDELAAYLLKEDGKKDTAMLEVLRRIVSLGRAGGVICIFATQKPDADTVDTKLRDLITYRLALRSATPQASDTILGQGWASVGANAQQIPDEQKGVGFLLAEGERPAKIKGYNLTDDDVLALAQRASERRVDEVLAEPAEGQLA